MRAPLRHGRLLCSLVVGVLTSGLAAHAAEPAPRQSDPWSTMRGCVAVLDRFMVCACDDAARSVKPRWIALADPGKKADAKELEARIRTWAKPDDRKRQCAIWTK